MTNKNNGKEKKALEDKGILFQDTHTHRDIFQVKMQAKESTGCLSESRIKLSKVCRFEKMSNYAVQDVFGFLELKSSSCPRLGS